MPRRIKELIVKLLVTDIFGRPLRKIMWTILEISKKLTAFLNRVFWNMPYVKSLEFVDSGEKVERLLRYYAHLRHVCDTLPYRPKISVLIPLYKVKPEYFQETLASVELQIYEDWEVCVVDDKSQDPRLHGVIKRFSEKHPGRVKFAVNPENVHISETSNRCLELATGEYAALLDHDDRLTPNALAEMVRHINLHDRPDILYSDERTISEDGGLRHDTYFKPDWSPFMHLCMNYTTHLSVYRLSLMREIGGFRRGFEGSQDHDLMLRMVEASKKPVVHVPFCLYQWRAHPQSTATAVAAKPYAAIAGEKAVTEACLRRGRPAVVEFEPETGHYRVKFEIKEPLPLVSIIIPSKNCHDEVSKCLSTVFEKSTYPNFEVVLVDNGSTDARCKDLYARWEKKHPERFRVIDGRGPFNFARLNHLGVQAAKGSYLLLLNNDTEILTPDWIEEMLRLAQFPEVGAVGCKLLYPDHTLQHCGILLASDSIAVHKGIGLDRNHNLYWQILNTVHEVTAVTAACLLIAREKFEAVGGFDEQHLPNGYGDVDFCLKLVQAGYTNLYTPYAILVHHESKSRLHGIETFERFEMMRRWGNFLMRDPYLNPNLFYGEHYAIRPTTRELEVGKLAFEYFLATPKEQWSRQGYEAFRAKARREGGQLRVAFAH